MQLKHYHQELQKGIFQYRIGCKDIDPEELAIKKKDF
jgi:hypothetical protein